MVPIAPIRRRLTLLPLMAATFFMVSGGPYGLEDLVQKAGYTRSLLVLLIVPLIWSVPTALMVGELSAALPEEGGYYEWVRRAMGDFWGFQEAWLSLLASIFDMAIYPTLFVLYLGQLVPRLSGGRAAFLVGTAVIAVAALWNIAGVRAVGQGSTLLMLLLLGPFAVMTGYALWRPRLAATPHTVAVDLLGAMSVATWNYMGWDNASTIAGEVENPQRNYPRAILGTVALVAFVYLVPVAAAMVAGLDPGSWSTGAWAQAAGALGGPALELLVVVGGMVCGLGMTNALILSYTRVPFAMAQDGFLPAVFARVHPRTGAPWVSILACAVAWCLCLPLGFERLILIDILLYGVALLLEFAALVLLRVREPNLLRPFRAPGGMVAALALAVGPVFLLILAAVRAYGEQTGPVSALGIGGVLAAAGVVVYFLAARRRSSLVSLQSSGLKTDD